MEDGFCPAIQLPISNFQCLTLDSFSHDNGGDPGGTYRKSVQPATPRSIHRCRPYRAYTHCRDSLIDKRRLLVRITVVPTFSWQYYTTRSLFCQPQARQWIFCWAKPRWSRARVALPQSLEPAPRRPRAIANLRPSQTWAMFPLVCQCLDLMSQ